MHYLVKGRLIKSENAARSPKQAAKAVTNWIDAHKNIKNALDYGCGKLRYAIKLYEKCDRLTLVDSEIQLTRQQIIFNKTRSIMDFVKNNWERSRVLSYEQFVADNSRYDTILCANVLSAIPSIHVRSKVLNNILFSLNKSGGCMFVTQFRNSYFKNILQSSEATPHLDGWILSRNNVNYYYGIIDRHKLQKLLIHHGYTIKESWTDGQSAFVFAGI